MTMKYGLFLKGVRQLVCVTLAPGRWYPAPRLLLAPSASAYNAGSMRAHAHQSLQEDRASSVSWARSLLEAGEFCILDSETTGLKPPVQFVEIAVVDADAKTPFEGTVRPDCR